MKPKPLKTILLVGALSILGLVAIAFVLSSGIRAARSGAALAGFPLLGMIHRKEPFMGADNALGGGAGGDGGGNTVDDDVNSLMASIDDVYGKCNAMLAGLPPMEQYEAAQELSYGLRCLKSSGQALVDMTASLKTKISAIAAKVSAKVTAAAKANAESALLTGGLYVKKTDADAALTQAVSAKETEVRNGFAAERQKEVTVTARRAALIEKKVLPAALANAISAEILGADNFAETIETLKTKRFPLIKGAGLDPEKATDFTAEIFALPLTDDGNTQVAARCDSVKKLIAATAAIGNAPATASKEFPVGGGGDSSGKPVRIF